MPFNRNKIVLSFACMLLLTACREEEATVEVMQLHPASMDISKQRIALLPFAGEAGDAWLEGVRAHLQERGFDVVPAFMCASLEPHPHRSAEEIARLASALRADLVIEGGTTASEVAQAFTPQYDKRTRTTTYVRQISLSLRAQAHVRDAQGSVLYRFDHNASHGAMPCGAVQVNGKAPHAPAWVESLFHPFDEAQYVRAKTELFVDDLRQHTLPAYRPAAWVLFQSKAWAQSLQAVDKARAMQWSEATALYEQGLQTVRGREARAMLQYNLGVSKVMNGEYAQASVHLRLAAEQSHRARVKQLCAEALADSKSMAQAHQQAATLGWVVGS